MFLLSAPVILKLDSICFGMLSSGEDSSREKVDGLEFVLDNCDGEVDDHRLHEGNNKSVWLNAVASL
jgi:hypothetical protein